MVVLGHHPEPIAHARAPPGRQAGDPGSALASVRAVPHGPAPVRAVLRRLQVGSDGALLGCDGRRVVGDHP